MPVVTIQITENPTAAKNFESRPLFDSSPSRPVIAHEWKRPTNRSEQSYALGGSWQTARSP